MSNPCDELAIFPHPRIVRPESLYIIIIDGMRVIDCDHADAGRQCVVFSDGREMFGKIEFFASPWATERHLWEHGRPPNNNPAVQWYPLDEHAKTGVDIWLGETATGRMKIGKWHRHHDYGDDWSIGGHNPTSLGFQPDCYTSLPSAPKLP